ncbi:MAG: manganese efflux pump [Clostridia bacterium]|nr:manganese efflux pump [Clostridia bacterium]
MMGFLLLTALTVSLDSFICGFSLAMKVKKKLPIVIGITSVVFLLCLLTNYLTVFFSGKVNQKTASIGGIILIAVGLFNLFKKSPEHDNMSSNVFKQSVLTGFAVGFDGAFANLSLSLMGQNAFYVPVIITAMHTLMISLGILLSQTKLVKKIAKIEFVSPLILIALGVYKLLGLFI